MEMSNVNLVSSRPTPLAEKDVAAANDEEKRQQLEPLNEKMDAKMALSYEDPTKVKFTNSIQENNGVDAKVDIEVVQVPFAGMGKEELMRYANDPFWVRLRWAFFILFWIIWLSMLIGAIVIVVLTPGCPPLPARDWWQKTVVYQIYPRSFKDSNGDGIGDIKGIESKLDYFKNLGVKTLWLSPIYKSPMADFGYDISDFKDIDPIFGTLDDFKSLVNSTKANDLKLVLDFVPNHSSDEHIWFQKSRNREGNYTDYYIWQDGTGPNKESPPNNWVSVFSGPAWTYDNVRQQFYLHQFLPKQPDLNYRNPHVREEMKNVLRFWLDLGVDGFRIDALKHLVERDDFKDEPLSNDTDAKPGDYGSLVHKYSTNQPETLQVNREWRLLLDEYEAKDGNHRLLIAEHHGTLAETMLSYGNSSIELNDFPFNFELLNTNSKTTASELQRIIIDYLAAIPDGKWPSWVLGNHDTHRIASRTHPDLADGYNMISMLIGGTPVTYYGEEIGMSDVIIPYNETRDPFGRDKGPVDYVRYTRDFERSPMQWNNLPNAGFTTETATPWLRISNAYKINNVQHQLDDPHSHLNIYKKLVKLRDEPTIIYGDLCFISRPNAGDVFSFARIKKGSPGFAVLFNLGTNATVVDLIKDNGCADIFSFPEDGSVEISNGHASLAANSLLADSQTTTTKTTAHTTKAIKIPFNAVRLGPHEALVIKFVPDIKAKS